MWSIKRKRLCLFYTRRYDDREYYTASCAERRSDNEAFVSCVFRLGGLGECGGGSRPRDTAGALLQRTATGIHPALYLERILHRRERRRWLGALELGYGRRHQHVGGLVGGTVGYNYQYDRAVFGVEGDIDWANINGGTTTAGCPLGCQTKDTWLSTVRGRLGYAAGRFMPFVTGGGAFGDIRASTPALAGGNTTNAGWTVGAGIEFALVGNWTAKAEYLYVDLGKLSCGAGCGAPVDNVSFTANIVRGGINYRF